MEYLTYLAIALIGSGLVFGLATIVLQDQVSRATEAVFDSIEYALASNKQRRHARRQQLRRAASYASDANDSSTALWTGRGRYAA